MVNSDETHFLAIGTKISAKYRGAFCEAKITKIISKSLKCQVQFPSGISKSVIDQEVKGQLKVGATVDIKCKDKKDLVKAKILKIQDCSQYTVEFGDRDVTCLKRTAIYLKNEKCFASNTALNQLPFNHPEYSGRTALVQGCRGQKRKISIRECEEEEVSAKDEKCIGKVVCVEANVKKKVRNNWFPGLIVVPTLQSSVKTNILENHLVRSFKDGKYYTVPKIEIIEFTKEIGFRVENYSLKTAVEKAIFYLDNDELPPHWDRDLLFGADKFCIATDSEVYDGNNSDRKSIEEKDHFVAQLYKFMDDRRTPINQAPVINKKDVDLYKLFKVVYDYGGFKKVDKNQQWMFVSIKAGFKHKLFASVKDCYQKYLLSFEDFYRKLGCTMLSYPRAITSRCRFSRSIISNKNSRTKKEIQEISKKEVDTLDNDQIIGNKKKEKKKSTKNLSRKSMQEHTKKEKVLEVKSAGTSIKKLGPIKEEIKTFLKVMTPVKKSKRGTSNTQKDTLKKGIFDGVPKLTKSKTNEDLFGKSKRMFSKVVQIKVVPFDRSTSINVGDIVSVYNRNKENSKAKVLKVNNIKGVMKYYIHYVGYNRRHDRWIDTVDIDYKINGSELKTEVNNDVDSSKVSSPKKTKKKSVKNRKNNKEKKVTLGDPSLIKIKAEPSDKDELFDEDKPFDEDNKPFDEDSSVIQNNSNQKKILSTTSRTRDSTTSIRYSEQTKSCYGSIRPTKTYTLSNNSKSNYDSSNKEVSDSKAIKPEPDTNIKIEPLPKSCMFEMHNNTSEEVEICVQLEVVEQNGSTIPFVPNSNSMYSFDNVELNVNENLIFKNEIKDSISHSQSENESNKSQNVMISGVIVNTSNIKEIRLHSQDNTCHEVNVSDIKDEVMDLCMKPLESPSYNIFSTPEPNYDNNMIVEEEDDDDDDDDEPKLVIVENDYQMDAFLVNHKSQHRVFMNNIDENTKFGFKLDLNSKLPTLENRKNIESATKLFCEFPVYEPTNNDMSKKYEHKVEKIEDKYANEKTMELPELQCRVEIEDKDTINNASVKEYNRKAEYGIFESKNFVDLIHQPSTSKDSFYKTNTISDSKNSFFVARQAVKSVIFDTKVPRNSSSIDHNISSISKSNFYENSLPSTYKSFYENSMPSTSKGFYKNFIPSTSKSFYENSIPSTSKSFYENSMPSTSKSFYKNFIPSTSKSFYENSMPSTSKSFYENSIPSTSKSFYENSIPSTSKSFYENSIPSTSKSFHENSIPSTSKSFYENSIPSTSKSFYENSIPSTSKSFYENSMPSTSKSFYENSMPSTSKSFHENSIPSTSKSFYENSIPSTSKSFYENSIPSTSKSFYENSMPSTSKSFYENSMPSTSKSFYYSKTNVNSVLFCEKIIPSPTSTVEPYDEVRSNKVLIEERDAALAMFDMNQSFHRPMTTLMHPSIEKKIEEYTNIFQNYSGGTIPNQRYSKYLAKISGRNVNKNINKPLVTGPIGVKPEPIVETNHVKKIMVMDEPIPMTNSKPLIEISPRMNYADEQTVILEKNERTAKKIC